MCDAGSSYDPETPVRLSRRGLLLAAAGAAAVPVLGLTAAHTAHASTATPLIRPRADWAGSTCPPRGPLPAERDGDMRFLLVHHTATTNAYTPGQVAARLRHEYAFHTGPEKGWPDLAYNFLVDRFGGIWEGRAGSLGAPVIPSATYGSQGYSQLACFVGNHDQAPPTAAAVDAMTSLLAFLARRYVVDTTPGATVRFVSRGSSRYPAGTQVTARTLSGHLDMSSHTACPGRYGYPLVRDTFPYTVTRLARRR